MLQNSVLRKLHRETGYFFLGLILSFSISGILQNHRRLWNPEQYIFSSKPIKTQLNEFKPNNLSLKVLNLEPAFQDSKIKDFKIEDQGKKLRVFLKEGIADLSLETGLGKIEKMEPRPIISSFIKLHKGDNPYWVWYSDVFALGLIFISISGLFLMKGKIGFKKRGFWFTIAGIIIPLISLIII